jgi:hypothetical protein
MKYLRRLSRALFAALLRRKPRQVQDWLDEHAFIG